eukprot:1157646-Pelagomonas_calceolata.AAC.12
MMHSCIVLCKFLHSLCHIPFPLPYCSLHHLPSARVLCQMSAMSNMSVESSTSSIYGDDIPPEIVALLEARRVADKLQTKWVALPGSECSSAIDVCS